MFPAQFSVLHKIKDKKEMTNVKKRILAAFLVGAMLAMTVSCGSKETGDNETEKAQTNETASSETKGAEETGATEQDKTESEAFNYMGSDLSPYITVGNYKGLSVTAKSSTLTEEEYQTELAGIMASYSYNEKITDRAVAEGDTVVTSFSGFKDGVAFEGGTSEESEVIAADGQGYIDGFGPAFIGQMPGVEFSFNVTFPAVYGNLDLAGKEVTFVCTISHIKGDTIITPELTDEFTRETFGYETVEDFEKMLREFLALQKQYMVENERNEALWSQVVEASEVLSYPAGELERYCDIVISDVKQTAAMYQVEYADFLANYLGMTQEQLDATALERAKTYVKENLIIYQIAKEQGVVISEERFNEEVKNAATMNGVTEEVILNYYGRDAIMLSLLQQEVFADIAEAANITVEETTAE